MDPIREVRNKVFHFRDDVTAEELQLVVSAVTWLRRKIIIRDGERSMKSVLELLREADTHPRVILTLLPGRGERRDLATFVAEVAQRGPVVVLTPSRVELDQWEARLQSVTSRPILTVASAGDALQFHEQAVLSEPFVLLATVQRARQGPVMNLLRGLEVALLLVDGPPRASVLDDDQPTASGQVIELLASRARQTIIAVPGTLPYDWNGAVSIRQVTEEDFARATAEVKVIEVSYALTTEELELQGQVRAYLRPYLPQLGGRPLAVSGVSELHHRLLAVVTQGTNENPGAVGGVPSIALSESDVQEAWRLLDALEDTTDSRLRALDEILTQNAEQRPAWLVTSVVIREVGYIADHLKDAGHRDVVELSSLTEPSERASALEFPPGRIVVSGRLAYSLIERWPANCNAIWLSPPSSRAEFESRVGVMATGRDVRVYQLTPRATARD